MPKKKPKKKSEDGSEDAPKQKKKARRGKKGLGKPTKTKKDEVDWSKVTDEFDA